MKLLIIDFNRTIYNQNTNTIYDGVLNVLSKFKQLGYTIVLLSTGSAKRKLLFEELDIEAYFDQIKFVEHKETSAVKEILKDYGASPKSCLIIGDNPNGELAIAKELGIPSIAVGTGLCSEHQAITLGATYLPSISEVINHVS